MIEIKNLKKSYSMGASEVHALNNVSLKIEAGEFVAIMGASGSGKSTLMHLLGLLDRPDSGSYLLSGKDVTKLSDDELAATRNRLVGFVFQQFFLLPRMTALENAELPLIYAGKRHLKELARERLEEVGLGERMTHEPNELSGGQQQRVAIARSLVNDPLIILADEPTGNLDSKSKEEILAVLKQLNEKGKTLIIVTHENEIAVHAKRIIKMRDGEIISDEPNCEDKKKCAPSPEAEKIKEAFDKEQKFSSQAELLDYIRQAASAMWSHKMRTFLSVLGILIGVAAVIAMLALGQGAQETISKQLSSLGSNLLVVMPGSARVHGVSMGSGTVTRFTFQDVAAISKMSEEISRIYPNVQGRGQLVYGNKNWSTTVEGDGPGYAEMRNSVPVVGRFFTEEEVKLRDKVAVIGFTVARELFGDSNPVGKTIKINLINFKVVGVLPTKGASGWHDQDDIVIIPVTTAMYRVFGKDYIDAIFVEVKSPDLIEETQDAITRLIIKQHRLSKDNEDTFQIRNMAEIKQMLETTTRTMALLLGSIAAISLLVGGIGIMNIMLVSVTERTREIGLRKAIGARNTDIMIQFLIEAALIAFIGGVCGIALGAGISSLIAMIAGWAVKLSAFSIILATGFSLLVGIVFGSWPAHQAAQLNPIEALRYE
ncbi:MAG: ABC transporter permease [Candidatus Omnitrophica bacterium]|nr:ABC transporter permease [Candidatus Omnitrophota bacterium]MDD5311202.1 ABC transporter permease [Candidatus Omnitrophota bacterium]MDD5546131.1 ABC transporter permease [Candidatus Omnitrophota bacterium]